MSHLSSIVRKELKELLTPGSVISVLVMVFLFAGMGGLIGGEVEKASELPSFGLVADDTDYYEGWNPYQYLVSQYGDQSDKVVLMESQYGDEEAIIAEMQEKGINSVLALPAADDFRMSIESGIQVVVEQYYLFEPTGMFGTISSSLATSIVAMLNTDLSEILISGMSEDADYAFLTSPLVSSGDDVKTVIDGVAHEGVTPAEIANTISSQTLMIPIVIMIVIVMIGSIVISSIGSEKENKTLETLLTLPIKRTTIVSGKIVASAIVGLVYGLAYMVGMSFYMGSLMSPASVGNVDLAALGMSLDMVDWVLILISMFLSIICALGICMVLGAFAKNYKSAQTMTMPLSILAMVPMFVIMFSGWYGAGAVVQGITFAIPFSHPMMAMQALMYGDVTLVVAGIAYMLVFALATILVTVKLYNSDILITGLGQNKTLQKLTGKS